jgi:hypothetical protein
MSEDAVRVVLRKGRKKRSFVVPKEPVLTVGDEVRLEGDPDPWTVLRIEGTEIILRILGPQPSRPNTSTGNDPTKLKRRKVNRVAKQKGGTH